SFTAGVYLSPFSPAATTTNSNQFNFKVCGTGQSFWWLLLKRSLNVTLMVKFLLWSKVEILVWMSFDLNNLDANNSVVMFMAKAELFMYVDPSNYWLVRPNKLKKPRH
ncbi:hypothetical protein HID58_093329, partial [Brassica napus]